MTVSIRSKGKWFSNPTDYGGKGIGKAESKALSKEWIEGARYVLEEIAEGATPDAVKFVIDAIEQASQKRGAKKKKGAKK